MRKWILMLLMLAATPALAQQINFQSIEKLSSKAKEKTEVTLDEATLKLASGFLSEKESDQATAKKITEGLKAIYVRTFEFDVPGAFSPADIQPIRDQLKGPQWSRIINVQEEDEQTEIWIHKNGTMSDGLLILSIELQELTFVNIVGSINPEDIGKLGGQFGIPKIEGDNKD
jgi:hypothetical protein